MISPEESIILKIGEARLNAAIQPVIVGTDPDAPTTSADWEPAWFEQDPRLAQELTPAEMTVLRSMYADIRFGSRDDVMAELFGLPLLAPGLGEEPA